MIDNKRLASVVYIMGIVLLATLTVGVIKGIVSRPLPPRNPYTLVVDLCTDMRHECVEQSKYCKALVLSYNKLAVEKGGK